ncbi:hypothetical protein SAICODRAFT_7660 [Saitoella complicata NRRL Y-17804]|uniref:uncharacterized protein n=1 Tax=Saitoella complicata (strain BCRC 22490 / CBS 7301 / JCM 7358 / NBRC 10748 / NRRL Y-17804) TaxID=698492 RepID=UPI0008673106|nr:uncharacterized protein SAICODRAFT_7660 [Saitoella complicata NRRL Y-17804]ODQ53064.1 hypothetical protein SAICODRAFT_7660 [Saitoella complicata NRRL Y-17804]
MPEERNRPKRGARRIRGALRPRLSAIVGTPQLADLTEVVTALTSDEDLGQDAPERAATIIATVFHAFECYDLLRLKDLPDLLIKFSSGLYTISLSSMYEVDPRMRYHTKATDEDSSGRGTMHRSACGQTTHANRGIEELLESLFGVDETEFSKRMSDLQMLDVRDMPSISCEHVDGPGDTRGIAAIFRCLDRLAAVDHALSIRTNCVYWTLGAAYDSFATAVTQGVTFKDDRTRSRYVLRRLLEEPWAVRASTEHGGRWVSALKKRVECARKFRSITSALPVSVLLVVPHICVTRLDKIGLKQLALLPSAVVAHGDSLAALLALMARTDEAVLQGLATLSGKGGGEDGHASSSMEE